MNSTNSLTSSFLSQPMPWASAIGGAALLTGALLTTYFLKNILTPSSVGNLNHQLAPVKTKSKWAYLNPLTLVAIVASTIFSLVMSPYYLVFGAKEYWMNQLPTPIHYDYFNGGSYTGIAQKARKNMKGLLEMMGAKDFVMNSLAKASLPAWSSINALNLPNEGQFSCGSFHLTGEEIKKQASSLRVSYDSSILYAYQLANILTKGSSSPKDEAIARGRMVSSLVASVCDSKGNPLEREGDLPLYRVYTSNAPNLAYSDYDKSQFFKHKWNVK